MTCATCDIVPRKVSFSAPEFCLMRQKEGQVFGVLVLTVQSELANVLFVYHIPYAVSGENEPDIHMTYSFIYIIHTHTHTHTHAHTWRVGWSVRTQR